MRFLFIPWKMSIFIFLSSSTTYTISGSLYSFDLKDLYGTYYGEKEHPNNKLFTHKVELTLKENNEATLHQSDGASSSFTTGSYKCENNRIIYTPLYYDYENQEKSKYNQDGIQYTFIISKGIEIELNYFYANKFPINMKIKK